MQRANLREQAGNDAAVAAVIRIIDAPLDLRQSPPLSSCQIYVGGLARCEVWWEGLRQRIAASHGELTSVVNKFAIKGRAIVTAHSRSPTRRAPKASKAGREWFVPALIGVVAVASLLPCYGAGARVFDSLALLAIGSLFFLQGARLSRDAIVAGTKNWRLHLGITSTTFVLFPLLGLALFGLNPGILTPPLQIGVLFVCALPSTVQSSIALTSIARGNVVGAICAATASNILGVILTPMLLALMLRVQGAAIDLNGLWKIFVELILPFIVGHLLRPWIGQWADQNRSILAITDRSSVLLVVYTAFSAAVVNGVWSQTPPITLMELVLVDGLLLVVVLFAIKLGSRFFAVPRTDEVAIIFCGSQKSAITGVPMAHLLFTGPAAGMIVLPIIIYHQLQLWLGAWLARRYASAAIVDHLAEGSVDLGIRAIRVRPPSGPSGL
jgi:sodium/bile acid cotransporter 7